MATWKIHKTLGYDPYSRQALKGAYDDGQVTYANADKLEPFLDLVSTYDLAELVYLHFEESNLDAYQLGAFMPKVCPDFAPVFDMVMHIAHAVSIEEMTSERERARWILEVGAKAPSVPLRHQLGGVVRLVQFFDMLTGLWALLVSISEAATLAVRLAREEEDGEHAT